MERARAEQGRITGELTLRQKDFLKGRDVRKRKTRTKGELRERETQRRLRRESRQVIGGEGENSKFGEKTGGSGSAVLSARRIKEHFITPCHAVNLLQGL